MNSPSPELDAMLTREQAAVWLQMTDRELAAKSPEHKPVIPAFRAGGKTIRYHPRTIIAKMARDAGVPMDIIAASFGITQEKKP